MSQLKVNTIRHTGASSDAVTLATDGTCTAKITNNLSNRNLIINGGMTINQRNGTYTAGDYCLDRYRADETTDGAVSITHSGVVPDGFANSLRVAVTTADTSLSGTQYADLYQYIEAQNLRQLAYGTSSAKKMTLSFYVRSNKTGNYGVTLWQNDNSNKQLSLQYTINSADTWERKTLTIPADTSGVINNDNGKGLTIYWALASGTTYTSGSPHTSWTTYANADLFAGQEVNLMDSTSNDWYITGVQLEVGDVATDFEHRSYADELARCMRYFELLTYNSTTNLNARKPLFGNGPNSTLWYPTYKVVKRTEPSLVTENFDADTVDVHNYQTNAGVTFSAVSASEGDEYSGQINIDTTGGVSLGDIVSWRWTSSETAWIGVSAEL